MRLSRHWKGKGMARIIYGVQGNGRGHAVRALTIARRLPRHEFLFLTHTDGLSVLGDEFPTVRCPNPETPVRSHRVAGLEMALRNFGFWLKRSELLASVRGVLHAFKPDVAITDYEYFVPLASREYGIPCLSIDHQHIVTFWSHHVPLSQLPSYVGARFAARFLFSAASHYLVVSFFRPASGGTGLNARLVPPLLRDLVIARASEDGDHVLAYQSTSTFQRFLPFLRRSGRPVLIYGLNDDRTEGNLTFRRYSEEGFLKDLASSSYVICGGGHTLISEALFLGKPVISFPISNIFEQFLNAHYLEKLGYGRCLMGFCPGQDIIPSFEAGLDQYRANIRKGNFCGNEEIFTLVEDFIAGRKLDPPLPGHFLLSQ